MNVLSVAFNQCVFKIDAYTTSGKTINKCDYENDVNDCIKISSDPREDWAMDLESYRYLNIEVWPIDLHKLEIVFSTDREGLSNYFEEQELCRKEVDQKMEL